jgi:spoIIIJ-associated protein
MANTMEFEGRTEDEAVEKAATALRLSADALDYTVIQEASSGVFGLGAKPVVIRVRPPVAEAAPVAAEVAVVEAPGDADDGADEGRGGMVGPAPEKAARAAEVTRALVERMGLAAEVSVRDEHEQIVVTIGEGAEGNVVGETFGASRPPAVPSFQFLLNKIVNRFPHDRKHIVVEVPSVPRRERRPAEPRRTEAPRAPQRTPAAPVAPVAPVQPDPELDPSLVEMARFLAERARSTGKVITVHPMLAADRRAVHQTITGIPGVKTVSEGDGLYRRLHVVPAAGGGEKADGERRGGRRRRRRRRGGGGGEGGGAAQGGAPGTED